MSEDCYDQSFLVSLYLKLVKFDEEIFKFVSIKASSLTECKIQKTSFENLRSNCDRVYIFDIMQISKSWTFIRSGRKTSEISVVSNLSKVST